MIVAATGHRPNKLGSYDNSVIKKLTSLAHLYLSRRSPDKVITGMAQGWDTAVALAAIELKIPLLAALPFEGQEAPWPESSKKRFRFILRHTVETVVVSTGGYAAWKMHARNHWMVNHCDRLVALWDGDKSGGTAKCLAYAFIKNKPIDNLWNSWQKMNQPLACQPSK